MSRQMTVVVEVRRHDPSQPGEAHYQRFQVTGIDGMRVLDVIRSIYDNQAGELAYQCACRVRRCGTCAIKVNGVPVLAVQEKCKPQRRIEPLSPVLRDLVVDRTEGGARYVG